MSKFPNVNKTFRILFLFIEKRRRKMPAKLTLAKLLPLGNATV